jgi:hypothetical protein
VIGNVSEFVRMQPQVKGMQYGSSDGNAEIRFQMGMPVPHECGDAISLGYTRSFEGSRQLLRTSAEISIGVSVARTVRLHGDD